MDRENLPERAQLNKSEKSQAQAVTWDWPQHKIQWWLKTKNFFRWVLTIKEAYLQLLPQFTAYLAGPPLAWGLYPSSSLLTRVVSTIPNPQWVWVFCLHIIVLGTGVIDRQLSAAVWVRTRVISPAPRIPSYQSVLNLLFSSWDAKIKCALTTDRHELWLMSTYALRTFPTYRTVKTFNNKIWLVFGMKGLH